MARQIIVLDAYVTGGNLNLRAAYWLLAPASRIVPLPTFVSQLPSSGVSVFGITSAEIQSLQSGVTVEQIATISVSSGVNQAAVQAALQAQYTLLQTALTSNVFASAHLVGSSYNGIAWTAGP